MNSKSRIGLAIAALTLSFGALASATSTPAASAAPAQPTASLSIKPAASPSSAAPVAGNPDEPVTRAQVIKRTTDQFDAVDTNKDGIVTKAELVAFRAQARPAGFVPAQVQGPNVPGPKGARAAPSPNAGKVRHEAKPAQSGTKPAHPSPGVAPAAK